MSSTRLKIIQNLGSLVLVALLENRKSCFYFLGKYNKLATLRGPLVYLKPGTQSTPHGGGLGPWFQKEKADVKRLRNVVDRVSNLASKSKFCIFGYFNFDFRGQYSYSKSLCFSNDIFAKRGFAREFSSWKK